MLYCAVARLLSSTCQSLSQEPTAETDGFVPIKFRIARRTFFWHVAVHTALIRWRGLSASFSGGINGINGIAVIFTVAIPTEFRSEVNHLFDGTSSDGERLKRNTIDLINDVRRGDSVQRECDGTHAPRVLKCGILLPLPSGHLRPSKTTAEHSVGIGHAGRAFRVLADTAGAHCCCSLNKSFMLLDRASNKGMDRVVGVPYIKKPGMTSRMEEEM